MKFTHTRDDGLASFFIGVDTESWVFFGKFLKAESHFFLVGFSFWFDGNRYRWIWEFD